MSVLSTKSSQNEESAKFLIQEEFYSSSVHCSYYSCVQLMHHLFYEKMKKSPEDLSALCEVEGNGVHVVLTNKIKQGLKSNGITDDDFRDFCKTIGFLKRNRTDADYKDIVISPTIGENSLEMAQKVNGILINYFK